VRVALPHDLDKETVRQRLRSRSHEIADHIPGGMAEVTTSWPSEDRMDMIVRAMGQDLVGAVELEDKQVVFTVQLPPMLGFLEPIVEGAIKASGQKLIGPPGS
jgi:hypothetical protein